MRAICLQIRAQGENIILCIKPLWNSTSFFYNSFKTGSRNQSQSLLLQLKLGKERGNGLRRDFKGIDDALFPTLSDKIRCLDLSNTILAT